MYCLISIKEILFRYKCSGRSVQNNSRIKIVIFFADIKVSLF